MEVLRIRCVAGKYAQGRCAAGRSVLRCIALSIIATESIHHRLAAYAGVVQEDVACTVQAIDQESVSYN